MSPTILTALNLHKAYGPIQAVRGVDLHIQRGEIFGLLGPNGAGKTTLLHMLTGLIPPDQGEILFNGHLFTPEAMSLKATIGLVPQELALYPTLSAWDNLIFFGRIYGLRGRTLRHRVEAVLDLVSLRDRARDPIQTYSGGMKRRINIAAGLLHQPDILFLDEPTVGVDPQSRNAIFEAVEALNREGLTILYTTHYMEEAQRLCHRVAIMDEGRIIALDTPRRLIQEMGEGFIRVGVPADQQQAFVQHITPLMGVHEVMQQDGHLLVHLEEPLRTLPAIFQIATTHRIPITTLQILEPDLETVFLQLTGKALRE